MKNSLKDLLFIIKSEFKESKIAAILQIIYGICLTFQSTPSVIFPALIIDEITTEGRWSIAVIYAALFAFFMFLPKFILSFIENLQSVHNMKLPHKFILDLAEKMTLVDYKETERSDFLDIYDNAGNMVFEACGNSFSLFTLGFAAIMKLSVLGYIISTLEPFAVVVVIASAVLNSIMNVKQARIDVEFAGLKSNPNRKASYAEGLISSVEFAKDCRAYKASSFLCRRFMSSISDLIGIEKAHNKRLFKLYFLQVLLSVVQTSFLYASMIYKYFSGLITVGSFTMYLGAAGELSGTISTFFRLYEKFKLTSIYFDKYKNFMNLPENIRKTGDVKVSSIAAPFDITFDGVSFKYPGRSDYALKNINCTIHSGEHIAIVGENVAGKTTFIKLLTRLYDVDNGEIRVGGRNIKEYEYDEYMKLFSPVFQDFQLFAYSVKENVTFDSYDDFRFDDAIKKAGIYERINRLPRGADTFMKKDYESSGVEFSGGERQKVAIARAFYKDSEIAVLDEPTAAIDPIAEKNIYQSFSDFTINKTAFFISHRMGSTRSCSRILVFMNGEIVESGTHDSLMSQKGEYFNMYQKQASYYN